jgi:hypothetical protein
MQRETAIVRARVGWMRMVEEALPGLLSKAA